MTSTATFDTQSFSKYGGTGQERDYSPSIRADGGYLAENVDPGYVSEGWKVGAIILIVLFVLAIAGLITFAILWNNLNSSSTSKAAPPALANLSKPIQAPEVIPKAEPAPPTQPKTVSVKPTPNSKKSIPVQEDEEEYQTAEDYINSLMAETEHENDAASDNDIENDQAFREAALLNQSVKVLS
jgi:hypothetical protein